ncbi:arginine--tRNA ligase [Candidatus Marinamargulisbacteria bacterium SCGC AAA071-K20]|nr:arginine--tRNA ligase [Candidatus Marinamargulisbacteria bacterium SCGC AAA071-K20]
MIKKELETQLSQALKELGFDNIDLKLERPKNPDHGDYASNVSFQLAKTLKKAPPLIAEDLKSKLKDNKISEIVDFNPVSGFLNITLKPNYLLERLQTIETVPDFKTSNQKILLEYVSANPTGPLHIGHGRWAVLGSAIASILKYSQHTVLTEFYINDAGSQVNHFKDSVKAAQEGNPIPEDGYHGAYILDLAKSDVDPLKKMISLQKSTLASIGVEFDTWFFESLLHNDGKVALIIDWLSKKELSYTKDDALWFKSTDYGDDKDRVLIKSDGQYTYFLVDIAYHFDKISRADLLVNIWGADHHGYVPRVRAAVMSFLDEERDISEAFKVIIGQLVSLVKEGKPVKMSKRTGEMISLDEVVEDIGCDATRFFLLNKSADTHIEFDLDLAKKSSQENPVYYIQYAHARIASLLKKSELKVVPCPEYLELNNYERDLSLLLIQLYDKVLESAVKFSPHILAQYLFDVAKAFHLFYHNCQILNAEEPDKSKRLFLLSKTQFVLKEVLSILGITAPDSM